MSTNIFDYATSEFSQDAMLCWLLAWSHEGCKAQDLQMHTIGKRFLDSLLGKCGQQVGTVQIIEIHKQLYRIDVLADINDCITLVIEDKTVTGIHSEQLQRYCESVENDTQRKSRIHCFIYFKPFPFSLTDELIDSKFVIYDRHDLMSFLNSIGDDYNYLFDSYARYIRSINLDVDSYATTPVTEWSWNAFQGFCEAVQSKMEQGEWRYVPTPSGGFLALYWHFNSFKDISEVHIQIALTDPGATCARLFYKIGDIESNTPKEVRDMWIEKLDMAATQLAFPIAKPPRLSMGNSISVREYTPSFPITDANGLLLMNETIHVLRQAMEVQGLALTM